MPNRCFTFKDLRVTFDAQFTFNEHIDIVRVSSVKTLGFIFRSCKRFRSVSCLRTLYFTLVRSKLEIKIVWSPIYRRGVDALESVQRKSAKYLLFRLIAELPPRAVAARNILILPSTNVIIVITCYIFCYVCCNCWKGISVLVTANCSVQQEPTGRSRKFLAGKGIRKCYLLVLSVSIVNKNNKIFINIKQKINSQ
jgi:hypothetical protein